MAVLTKDKVQARLKREFDTATKLWQILKIALHDLRLCEKDRRKYCIDMGVWLRTFSTGRCHVCLAGACMTQRLGLSNKGLAGFGHPVYMHLPPNTISKLEAINHLRIGNVIQAYQYLYEDKWNKKRENLDNPELVTLDYPDKQWWPEIRKLLRVLKEADL